MLLTYAASRLSINLHDQLLFYLFVVKMPVHMSNVSSFLHTLLKLSVEISLIAYLSFSLVLIAILQLFLLIN